MASRKGRIFISYRRADNRYATRLIYKQLCRHFGADNVFWDIADIDTGENFRQVIEEALGKCNVLVAVLGTQWITITNDEGRRLDNPKDFVRKEISLALTNKMAVIPVLIDGAQMPSEGELPGDLEALANIHALKLSDEHWDADVETLVTKLKAHVPDLPSRWPKIAAAAATLLLPATLYLVFKPPGDSTVSDTSRGKSTDSTMAVVTTSDRKANSGKSAGNGSADFIKYTLEGRVVSASTQASIADAEVKVTLLDEATGRRLYAIPTSRTGRFVIKDSLGKAGRLLLQVTAWDYKIAESAVLIGPSDTTIKLVPFRLVPQETPQPPEEMQRVRIVLNGDMVNAQATIDGEPVVLHGTLTEREIRIPKKEGIRILNLDNGAKHCEARIDASTPEVNQENMTCKSNTLG